MANASLSAQARTGTGTGNARKLRQAGSVPAVVYGHGRETQSITLNTRELDRLLSSISVSSTVIQLSIDGTTSNTLIREIQRHPVKRSIVHVDFQQLVAGEKITVSIPLRFVGTPEGVRLSGGILEEVLHQVHLKVDPSSIPSHIEVDVTPLTIGRSIHVGELPLPEGVIVLDDEDATVCVCAAPKTEAAGVGEAGEGGAGEPELIRKAKAEGEGEAK